MGVTGNVTGSELAEVCQQSHVSVMGHNTISKSHWTKALLRLSAPFTPCPRRNLRLCVSMTRALPRVHPSSGLPWGSGLFHETCSLHNLRTAASSSWDKE